jgi:hypothetical protein
MSTTRRPGSHLQRFRTTGLLSAGGPGGEAEHVNLCALDVNGVTQLFAYDSDNFLYQISPSTGGTSVVMTFSPEGGSATGPLVFDDWNQLYNQLVAMRLAADSSNSSVQSRGIFYIVIEPSEGDTFIPNGSYDLDRVVLMGSSWHSQVDVTFEVDNTTITNLRTIIGLNIKGGVNSVFTPLGIVVTGALEAYRTIFRRQFTGLPPLTVPGSAAIYLRDGSQFLDTDPVIDVSGDVNIYLDGPGTFVFSGSLGGTGQAFTHIRDANARYQPTQPNITSVFVAQEVPVWVSVDMTNPDGVLRGEYGMLMSFASSSPGEGPNDVNGNVFMNVGGSSGNADWCPMGTTTVLRATTPGVGAGESVEVIMWHGNSSAVTFTNGTGHIVQVTAVARGDILGSPAVQMFSQKFCVRTDGFITTIAGLGTMEQVGDAAAASWTLVPSIGVGPDHLVLTFNTGTTTSLATIYAKVIIDKVP